MTSTNQNQTNMLGSVQTKMVSSLLNAKIESVKSLVESINPTSVTEEEAAKLNGLPIILEAISALLVGKLLLVINKPQSPVEIESTKPTELNRSSIPQEQEEQPAVLSESESIAIPETLPLPLLLPTKSAKPAPIQKTVPSTQKKKQAVLKTESTIPKTESVTPKTESVASKTETVVPKTELVVPKTKSGTATPNQSWADMTMMEQKSSQTVQSTQSAQSTKSMQLVTTRSKTTSTSQASKSASKSKVIQTKGRSTAPKIANGCKYDLNCNNVDCNLQHSTPNGRTPAKQQACDYDIRCGKKECKRFHTTTVGGVSPANEDCKFLPGHAYVDPSRKKPCDHSLNCTEENCGYYHETPDGASPACYNCGELEQN